jgi:hypothetical protein
MNRTIDLLGISRSGLRLLLFLALIAPASRVAAAKAVPLSLALPARLAVPAADTAKITYRRIFKGSIPEFIEINVSDDGAATFDIRQLSEDADPQPFEVGSAVRAKIFELAGQLHNFAGVDLDVHRRIADLGEKTLRYEKGATVQETHFNYTINHDASQLVTIFEGLSRQMEDQTALEQKLRYDRLGVNDALLHLEGDLAQRTLPEPERLLPVLDRIAADSRLIEVARQRARSLAERIRTSQTPAPTQ